MMMPLYIVLMMVVEDEEDLTATMAAGEEVGIVEEGVVGTALEAMAPNQNSRRATVKM